MRMRSGIVRKPAGLPLLLVTGLLSVLGVLAGCAAERTAEPADKLTLTLRHGWTSGHDRTVEAIVRDAVERYELLHPNVNVRFEGIDPVRHRELRLRSEMAAGNPPDLFALYGGMELRPYAEAGRLLNLEPLLEELDLGSRFHDLTAWTTDEGVFGLPIEGSAYPVYYNRKLFAELGLSVPQDEQELEDTVRALRAGGYVPFALGNVDRQPGAAFAQYYLQRYAGELDANFIPEGEGTFRKPVYSAAADSFARLLALKPFPDNANALSEEAAAEMFRRGEAGMLLGGSWGVARFRDDREGQIGVFNFPRLTGARANANGIAGGYAVGLGASAELSGERLEAALGLLREIYSEAVQERLAYEAMRIPAMRIPIDYERTGPLYRQLSDLLLTRSTFMPYEHALPPELQQQFFRTTQEWIGKERTAEQAIAELDDGLRRLKDRQP